MGKSKQKKKKADTQLEDEHVEQDKPRDDVKEKITVKIETLSSKNQDKMPPIIGYFPSRYNPLNQSEREDTTSPKVKVFKDVTRSNRYKVVVSPSGSKVEYVGTNYSGEATAPQLCTYALGVLDKSTQTLKVVPIATNKIFRLEPRIGGMGYVDDEPQDTENTEEKKAEEPRALDPYLSKKTIRGMKKMELFRHHDDPEMQQDIDRKIEGFKIDEAHDVAATTTNSRNIPPHNLDATEPNMVYPLDKIIFKGEWDYLLDIFELSEAGAEVPSDVYPSYVRNRAYKLDGIKDEVQKRRFAGILSYITHLIKFKDKHSMEGISSAKHHKIPGILFQKFSSMFEPGLKGLPSDKRDLLVSYVLVLALFVDEFRSDPKDIALDLRMNHLNLRPYYNSLGCKFAREKQSTLATLPVPLQFPTIRKRKRRR